METTLEMTVAAPRTAVATAIVSEAFQIASMVDRAEVVDAVYNQQSAGHFELRCTEYHRTKTGGLDRSATDVSRTSFAWNEDIGVLTWHYTGPTSRWVSVSGAYHLLDTAPAITRIEHRISVTVHIPLVGRVIAGLVARELQHGADRYQRLLTEHVGTDI